MAKILAFAGSTRKGSYNKKLVAVAAKGAEKAGAEVTIIDLADFEMPIFSEDLEAEQGIPENAQKFKQLLASHDGFLISSPEYNSSYSALLKNAIDWASRKQEGETPMMAYQGKVAGIMAASPGALGGMRGLVTLRMLLENIGVMVLPNQRAIAQAYEVFDDDGDMKDVKQQTGIEAIGQQLNELADKIN